jgi:quercetin dioxygenase-like cupin family protein
MFCRAGLESLRRDTGVRRPGDREDVMSDIDRRSAFSLGMAAAAFAVPQSAGAQARNEGREIRPGVRQVDLGERESELPVYKRLKMRDIVIQPEAATPDRVMMKDMLCHMTEGELAVRQNGSHFTVRKGDVRACAQGNTTEGTKNNGSTVAVVRIIDLLPG